MRNIIEEKDRKKIMNLYNNGFSIKKISLFLGLTENTVKRIVREESGSITDTKKIVEDKIHDEMLKKTKRKTKEQLTRRIVNLFNIGTSIDDIITKVKDLTRTEIEDIIIEQGLIEPEKIGRSKAKEKHDLEETIRNCKVGSVYKLGAINGFETVKVNAMYNRFVTTDKGSFTYIELMLGQKLS